MESKTVRSGGIGFVGLLQLLFIALKLIGIIDWPWVFVLLPFIISAGLIVVVLVFLLIAALVASR